MTERTKNSLASDLSTGGSRDNSIETRWAIDLLDSIVFTDDAVLSNIDATADEINAVADVSARVLELTASGAVGAGVSVLELNHATVAIAATMDVDEHQNSIFIIKNTSATGEEDHTLTLTNGTFNGSATAATLDARDEMLVVYFDSAGRGQVIVNVGTVGLA